MRKHLGILFLVSCLYATNFAIAASYGDVKVEGRKLLVNQNGTFKPYIICGVGYSPAPVNTFFSQYGWCERCDRFSGCTYPDNNGDGFVCESWPDSAPSLYDRKDVDLDRDFSLLNGMSVNTIRTWDKVTSRLLDKARVHGLKVIAGFWVDYGIDFSNTPARAKLLKEFEDYVKKFKDNKAILFWTIGNESNYKVHGQEQLKAMYSLFNEMAGRAHQLEGGSFHPVSLVNGDLVNLGNSLYLSDDVHLPNIDLWGINVYRGKSFGSLFKEYQRLSQKPLWIAEYGADAYDNIKKRENQKIQADWAGDLWDEIIQNNSYNQTPSDNTAAVCVGASIMSFVDEYWKAQGEWKASAGSQETGGMSSPGAAPDNFKNEEWWGLFAIADQGKNPDQRFPRLVTETLRSRFSCSIGN